MRKIYRREVKSGWLRIWLLFISVTAAHAQTIQTPTVQWQRLLGSSRGLYPKQAIRANNGGYAVVYSSVLRLSESGGTLWELKIPDSPDFPGYPNTPTFIAAVPDGGFGVLTYNQFKWSLARLNSDGTVRWIKSFADNTSSSSSSSRQFTGLIYMTDGGFLATADISYSRMGSSAELYKFDNTGVNTIKTAIGFPGGNNPRPTSSAKRIIQTIDENYLLVGAASGTSSTPSDWVAKLDPQLTVIWQKKLAGRGFEDVIISPYDNSAFIAVGSVTGTDTRSLTISANGDITDSSKIANRASFTSSFLIAGTNPTSHTIVDIVNERQGDIRLQTVVGQTLSYQQKLGGSGAETVTGAVAGSDGGFLLIGTTTSTDGDIQGKTNTDAEVWLVKVGPVSNSVYSVKSGNWNDPSVWSCNCAPAAWQNVTINGPHTVRLDATMPAAACLNLEIIGTFSMQGSSITINGASVMLDDANVVTN